MHISRLHTCIIDICIIYMYLHKPQYYYCIIFRRTVLNFITYSNFHTSRTYMRYFFFCFIFISRYFFLFFKSATNFYHNVYNTVV